MIKRVLFARVGWMRSYQGSSADDPRPIGGGSYTAENVGSELYNFLKIDGQFFGYFQPQLQPKERRKTHPSSIHLEKIEPGFEGDELADVLVILVASRPRKGGQYVVGWYPSATVYRHEQPATSPVREDNDYYIMASNAVLVPEPLRVQKIPGGGGTKGGFGTANICYRYTSDGKIKDAPWMDEAIEYALSYKHPNAAMNPESASDPDIAEAVEAEIDSGAGFQSDPAIRKAIEEYAMAWAEKRLTEMGLNPRDKHKTESFDFLCTYNGADLFVEVKGTQTDGTCVFLTTGEVKHSRDYPNSALFIVYGVKVQGNKVSGGEERLMMLDTNYGKLEARGYTYSIPIKSSESGFATKAGFQNLPMPEKKENLRLHRQFNTLEFEQIKKGYIPTDMDEKWFVYFDPETKELFVHRSWTGYCTFQMEIERNGNDWLIGKSWVSRDRDQYQSTSIQHDREVASWVIDVLLLKRDIRYPTLESI